jgi:hypothetical protein
MKRPIVEVLPLLAIEAAEKLLVGAPPSSIKNLLTFAVWCGFSILQNLECRHQHLMTWSLKQETYQEGTNSRAFSKADVPYHFDRRREPDFSLGCAEEGGTCYPSADLSDHEEFKRLNFYWCLG